MRSNSVRTNNVSTRVLLPKPKTLESHPSSRPFPSIPQGVSFHPPVKVIPEWLPNHWALSLTKIWTQNIAK